MPKMWINLDILVEVDVSNESDIGDIIGILRKWDNVELLDFRVQPDKLDNEDESVSSVIRAQRELRVVKD